VTDYSQIWVSIPADASDSPDELNAKENTGPAWPESNIVGACKRDVLLGANPAVGSLIIRADDDDRFVTSWVWSPPSAASVRTFLAGVVDTSSPSS
jgi:hypothetical protein